MLSEVEVKAKSAHPSLLNFFLPGTISLFLIFTPWFYGLRYLADKLLAQILIFGLSFFTFPFLNWKNVLNRGSRRLNRWIFASLALGFLYILISVIPSLSFLAFLQLAGCVSLYVLIRSAAVHEKIFLFFLSSIVFCGFFYSVYGLLQYYGFLPHAYWFEEWFLASRFINGGHFAVFLFIPFFTAASLILSNKNLVIRGVLTSALFVMGWAFLLTHSRAPWLVLALGGLYFLWLLSRHRLLSSKEILGICFFLGASVGLLILAGGMKEIVSRFGQMLGKTSVIFDPNASGQFFTVFYRLTLWQESLSAFLARPWGWGLGTFEHIFPQFRTHSDRFRIDYAHNEILQIGVDLGIIGLLFLAGFLIYYFKRMRNFLRSPLPSRSHKIYAVGLMTAVASLLIVSQVDFPLRVYANSFFFAAVLALSSSLFGLLPVHSKSEHRRMPVSHQLLLRIGLPALLAVFMFFSAREYLAQAHYTKAIAFDKNFEWPQALTEYESAIALSPIRSEYYEGLGNFLEKKETLSFNQEDKKKWRSRALWAYKEAVNKNSYNASGHYKLALIYQNYKNPEEAKKEFLKAIALEPLNAAYVSEYGLFALENKWTPQGVWAFEKYSQIPFKENARFPTVPQLLEAVSPYMIEYHDLQRIIPDTAEGHYHLGVFLGNHSHWEFADQELGKAIKKAKRAPTFSDYWISTAKPIALFYMSQNRIEQAQKLYQEAVKKNPNDTESLNQLQQIEQMKKPSVTQVSVR